MKSPEGPKDGLPRRGYEPIPPRADAKRSCERGLKESCRVYGQLSGGKRQTPPC
jgi:hypothetical protein